jgi:hypothetical protein
MEPMATHKQQTLIKTLREMKNRPTFAEQWPDTYKTAFKNGKNYQSKLDTIRKETNNIEKIYSLDADLYKWWTQ